MSESVPARPPEAPTAARVRAAAPARPPAIPGVPADRRRAIVVGASSGIGAALVRQLVREGYAVAALARRREELEKLEDQARWLGDESGGTLTTRVHDVRDTAAVAPLFEALVRELGGLDLLIYAAGVMPALEKREYDTEKDLFTLAVNTGGAIAWCNPAAHLFTTQRAGTLVGISSIAGDRGRKGFPVYCTSKAALDTYLEALRNRLSEVGVHVCTIKPGYVDTAMTRGMEGLFWLASPEQAAAAILRAARGRANVRYVLRRWWLVGTVLKLIPSFLFRRLSI
jgi:NAD(P)-dependent dehydrogenase (short-subunit alcohol dehydrogenase family)